MKNQLTVLLFTASVLLATATPRAQDTSHAGVVQKINSSSEKADNRYGKKIQQQSLSNRPVTGLNAVANKKTALPISKKRRRRK